MAEQFFYESNFETFHNMSHASKNHLETHMIRTVKQKMAFLTPRASNVRFSSFNRNVLTDKTKKSHLKKDSSSLNRVDFSETVNGTTFSKKSKSSYQSDKISGFGSGLINSEISKEPTRHTILKTRKYLFEMTQQKIQRKPRAKSRPTNRPRDLVYEWEMMGLFFKRLYGENKVFVIQKSKTFDLKNCKKSKNKKKGIGRSKELFLDFEVIKENKEKEDIFKSDVSDQSKKKEDNLEKMFSFIKSVKSVDSLEKVDVPKPKIKELDPMFEIRKQRNFSKRFYMCKNFTKKCQEMYNEYKESEEKYQKLELEKYKRMIKKMKEKKEFGEESKKLGLFDMPFEKRIKFIQRMRRHLSVNKF
jgi:hypothetical protein